jgi:hypothetical protein
MYMQLPVLELRQSQPGEKLHSGSVGFEVLTVVSTKMAVFWVVAPCSPVEVYQCFRGPCCLHRHGDESLP